MVDVGRVRGKWCREANKLPRFGAEKLRSIILQLGSRRL